MSAQPTTELLAKARAAVVQDLKKDTGEDHPRWRVIITDGESPTGVAPVCTAERGNALHMIDDYPGGPVRDEDGVYDCCPWPQFDTYSTGVAEYLVALLNADAEEKATAAAATATPLMVFRASHDAIVMGHYTTRQAAYEHCEAYELRDDSVSPMAWNVDEDGVAELVRIRIPRSPGAESPTGYVVTPVEVASEYDPEDDE